MFTGNINLEKMHPMLLAYFVLYELRAKTPINGKNVLYSTHTTHHQHVNNTKMVSQEKIL